MKSTKKITKKPTEVILVEEPLAAYKIKRSKSVRKKAINQLLVTPKNNRSLIALKKLLNHMEDIDDVEVIEDGEVRDDALLKKMIASKKNGYVSEATVMTTLNKIIQGK